MANNQVHLIKAIDPGDLLIQVNERLANGQDLYAPLFVSHEGLLCQRVVKSMCIYEYRLIIANELDDLELQEGNLTEVGFDYIFDTVLWHGKYLQWMCRMNSSGLTVRDAVAKFHASQTVLEDAKREDELQLVADVQKYLHMVPTANKGHLVSIPFPVSYS